jgi:hypothetical protein
MTRHTLVAVVAATSATATGLAGPAGAAPAPAAALGQHIASCAQSNVGRRDNAPSVTCIHDGMVMSFPTFGAMVQHMSEMHGG